ncbi:MAG: prolyl oligopeptidase family serine peptidase [Gemmatimonadaceae bacterium]|nr:prolyl oligopeptidase family serine peptidase [Gemmatimonadaceae bacterium]
MSSVSIFDPLRWLEDTTRADVRTWLAAQSAYTDSITAHLVGTDSLAARMKGILSNLPTLDLVRESSSRLVLTRWLRDDPSLLALNSGAQTERTLIADTTLARLRNGASIRAFTPSWDGRYVAIGTTERGDTKAAISVVDAQSGTLLRDVIPDLLTSTSGTRYEVTWLPDGSGFIYPRRWPGSANGSPADQLARGRQFLHRLGTPQTADVPLFGFEVHPSVTLDKVDLPTRVLTGVDSRWLVGSIFRSKQNGTDYFAAPFDAKIKSTTAPTWTSIATVADLISVPQLRGDTVYAISRRNADRGAIMRRVLTDGNGRWQTVVPERRGVITNYSVQSDGLYFTERDAGAIALRHLVPGTTEPKGVTLPITGTVQLLRRAPTLSGAVVSVQTWATTPRWLRVSNSQAHPLGIEDGSNKATASSIVADRLEAPSRDGTLVPVSLVYDRTAMKGKTPNGSAPLLIEAYGGFGSSADPQFDPKVLAWTAAGGVYAYAHVRGGGELGDAWHRAATRENKQRSIDDMIGAIEALIAKRYTSAGRVVITGTSFGANIPGLVMVQRPELLGAVLYEVGQPDEIRGSSLDPTAARNIAELGDLETEAGVRALVKASPYHQVPERIKLPAVILHSASEDYNFGSEMLVGKYVARLQAANTGTRPVVWVRTGGGHAELLYSPEWTGKIMSFLLWQTGDPRYQPKP